MLYHDVTYGALTQLYAGTTADVANLNGKVSPPPLPTQAGLALGQYLVPLARIGNSLAHTQDPQQGMELWEWLEEQVKNV
jgi:retinol dehydrogenase-12